MNRKQRAELIGLMDDRHIAEALSYDPALRSLPSERSHNMKTKRILTLALAATLVLALGLTAYAVVNRRVQDLVLPSAEPAAEASESQSYDPLSGDVDMISLQGFADSPEYQATLAWAEFEHGNDRDGEILAAVGNDPTPWDEKYGFNGYGVYSQEMADKLDEIAAAYGLTLHSGGTQFADMDELYARFGAFSTTEEYSGYYYADGTFQCDCLYDGFDYQLRRCMKGTLDTVLLNITDAESYAQWEYTAACGETVLLALGPGKALILADLDTSFVVVNILDGTEGRLTPESLQTLADSFDFSVL